MIHESARHALEQRKKYARWLDADDAVVVANAMLIIIGRALNMLKRQIEAQDLRGGRGVQRAADGQADRGARAAKGRGRSGLPAMRQAHAPPQIGQGRFLGMLRLSGLQTDPAGMREAGGTLLTALTGLTILSMRSIRSIRSWTGLCG